jgi:hypothetical protein
MPAYVFSRKPKFCLAFKPGLIWVRCSKCNARHREYLGPPDRDEKAAEREFIRAEYQRVAAILQRGNGKATRRRGSP